MSQKMHVCRKKGLRVSAANSRTPLTGRAETLQRGARRAGHTGNGADRNETQDTKFGDTTGGARHKVRRILLVFVSTLFEIDSI